MVDFCQDRLYITCDMKESLYFYRIIDIGKRTKDGGTLI